VHRSAFKPKKPKKKTKKLPFKKTTKSTKEMLQYIDFLVFGVTVCAHRNISLFRFALLLETSLATRTVVYDKTTGIE
jgi:hypothetical protein